MIFKLFYRSCLGKLASLRHITALNVCLHFSRNLQSSATSECDLSLMMRSLVPTSSNNNKNLSLAKFYQKPEQVHQDHLFLNVSCKKLKLSVI